MRLKFNHIISIFLFATGFIITSCATVKVEKEFWDNKVLKSEYTYINKVRQGIQKNYDDSGKLKHEYYCKNGLMDGISISYYPNSNIEHITSFRNGKLNGKAISFYESGELMKIKEYKNDTSIGNEVFYYKSGHLKYACKNCSVKCMGEMDSLQTTIEKSDYDYFESVWCGEFSAYSEKGNLIAQGNYYPGYHIIKTRGNDGVYTSVIPIRNGVWKFYNERGKLEEEHTYDMGILITKSVIDISE